VSKKLEGVELLAQRMDILEVEFRPLRGELKKAWKTAERCQAALEHMAATEARLMALAETLLGGMPDKVAELNCPHCYEGFAIFSEPHPDEIEHAKKTLRWVKRGD